MRIRVDRYIQSLVLNWFANLDDVMQADWYKPSMTLTLTPDNISKLPVETVTGLVSFNSTSPTRRAATVIEYSVFTRWTFTSTVEVPPPYTIPDGFKR